MFYDISLALSFSLAFISVVAIFFTDKKLSFSIIAGLLFLYFFKANINKGTASLVTLLIFISGMIFLALEIFVPSFGLLGILGLILTIYAVYDAFDSRTETMIVLISTSLAVIISITAFVKLGFSADIFNKNILNTSQKKERGYNSRKDYSYLVGKEGISLSPLRPSGRIIIDGDIYDAKSDSQFIESDIGIKVKDFKDGSIIVEKTKNL